MGVTCSCAGIKETYKPVNYERITAINSWSSSECLWIPGKTSSRREQVLHVGCATYCAWKILYRFIQKEEHKWCTNKNKKSLLKQLRKTIFCQNPCQCEAHHGSLFFWMTLYGCKLVLRAPQLTAGMPVGPPSPWAFWVCATTCSPICTFTLIF